MLDTKNNDTIPGQLFNSASIPFTILPVDLNPLSAGVQYVIEESMTSESAYTRIFPRVFGEKLKISIIKYIPLSHYAEYLSPMLHRLCSQRSVFSSGKAKSSA